MSRDELEALQLRRLQWTVRHAYENVPMYREKFDAHGVHPDDLRELGDLSRFPTTTKEDLRQNYPFKTFAVPMEQVRRVHASSGTTGRPTVVGYTERDLANWATVGARCFRLAGVRPGMLVQNSYGYGLFTGGLGAHAAIERLGATVIPMSGGQTERQIQLIQDFEPQAIACTPTYLLTILDAMRRKGLDPRATSLKYAVLGAEPWTEQMRAEIEEGLDLTASDIYGLSEVIGPGVAGESFEHQNGSTIWEDHFLPEICDRDDLAAVLADGEEGELVFTSLTKEAMPIIRYRTKDLSRLLPGDARPNMRRMQKIRARTDDMIILRGVNLFPSQIEELALPVPELSPHYQLELTRPNRMDELTVVIERRPEVARGEAEAGAERLVKDIKVHIGSSVRVQVAEPNTIERSAGKMKRVYDRRGLGE
ncbi:phenylacetate--CoA ligase PaaK [Pseudoclavibacter endophyticus]|uniref:Phenylacetate-coenzyme A ligase n=1 Tax=Pseudoclavibacter endophyticus TaxID=1778590 RepID=A0A6H9WHX6_9MICO|nr:phenylacetate--CoA ligase PaaK [Pseudoclavibacter endophyticus]KAB1650579.1 phenylacetate--CoA ligase [Pseudoclavibacter endophyticus]